MTTATTNNPNNKQPTSLLSLRDRMVHLVDGGALTLDRWQGAHYITLNSSGALIMHDIMDEVDYAFPVERLEMQNWLPYVSANYARR